MGQHNIFYLFQKIMSYTKKKAALLDLGHMSSVNATSLTIVTPSTTIEIEAPRPSIYRNLPNYGLHGSLNVPITSDRMTWHPTLPNSEAAYTAHNIIPPCFNDEKMTKEEQEKFVNHGVRDATEGIRSKPRIANIVRPEVPFGETDIDSLVHGQLKDPVSEMFKSASPNSVIIKDPVLPGHSYIEFRPGRPEVEDESSYAVLDFSTLKTDKSIQ